MAALGRRPAFQALKRLNPTAHAAFAIMGGMHARTTLFTALCAAQPPELRVALNVELPADGSAPEWVELIPAGPEVVGRDGRRWLHDQPDNVITQTLALGRDIPVDWEHATELRAPKGDEAPAAGWITALENRGGAIWGRVAWTPRGRESVASREYRYLSPVFVYEKATGRIVRLSSVGLTNSPNLHLTALNRGDVPGATIDHEVTDMKQLSAAIRKALGLGEDADEAQAVAAINTLKDDLATARNRAETPSLEKFVPRADYDQALARATNAEQALKTLQDDIRDKEIDAAIDAALKAGKITPATVDYHKAQCRQAGGLERFRKFVEVAPAVADPSGLDGKTPQDQGTALNAEVLQVAALFGHSAEDIAKYGK